MFNGFAVHVTTLPIEPNGKAMLRSAPAVLIFLIFFDCRTSKAFGSFPLLSFRLRAKA
jgi:hypothetical protein